MIYVRETLSDIEKLSYIFSGLVVTYPNPRLAKPRLKSNLRRREFPGQMKFFSGEEEPSPSFFLKAEDFSVNSSSDVEVARKGLAFCSRRRFSGLAINSEYTEPSEVENIPLEYSVRKSSHIKYVRFSFAEILDSQVDEAEALLSRWKDRREFPEILENLPDELDTFNLKVFERFGRLVYGLNRNKGFGDKARTLIDEIKKRANRMKMPGNSNFSLEGLTKVVMDIAEFSNGVRDNLASGERIDISLLTSLAPYIASNALEIRNRYGERIKDLREGIVFSEDREELIDKSRKSYKRDYKARGEDLKESEKHLMNVSRTIVRIVNNQLGQIVSMKGTMKKRTSVPASFEEFVEIGRTRLLEIGNKDKFPYKKERKFLRKIIEYRLNRRNFQTKINSWLEGNGFTSINWDNLRFD